MSMGVYIVIGLVALGIIVWLATSGVWMILKWVGRSTHLDEPVDRFFDAEGRLDPSDYLKFKEKHPRDGRGGAVVEVSGWDGAILGAAYFGLFSPRAMATVY